jgi:phage terminase large subunit-like protein
VQQIAWDLRMADSYKKALEDSKKDLRKLVSQRDEINLKIERKQAVIKALANALDDPDEASAQIAEMDEIVSPVGLTDKIRIVLRSSMDGFTAVEVRGMLEALKFDLSDYSNALATIHTTLKRLERAKEVKSEITPTGDKVYIWQPVRSQIRVFPGKRGKRFPRWQSRESSARKGVGNEPQPITNTNKTE